MKCVHACNYFLVLSFLIFFPIFPKYICVFGTNIITFPPLKKSAFEARIL